MSEEEFDDNHDLDLEDDLDADSINDDLVDDDGDDLDILDDDLDLGPEVPVAVVTDDTAAETVEDEDDDVVDLDEELHPDDVEEPLDVLLQERTAAATLEDDEEDLEEDDGDADDRVDGPTRIVPRRPDEFLCQSCFLLLPLRRLADKERQYCDDCA
jgi:hypothetical protein